MQPELAAQANVDPPPPLRLLEFRRSGVVLPPLPIQVSPLIGRDAEKDALRDLLLSPTSRLVTITGAGGIGKTSLALEVATWIAREGAMSAGFVPFAHLLEAEQIPGAISSCLKLATCGAESLLEYLGENVQEPLLLVLDNIEQIRDGGVFLIRMLAAAPCIKILVTSRAPLHVRGEIEFQLGPLAYAATPHRYGPETDPAAVALFIARAQDVSPGFRVTPERRELVTEICRTLDGLPLAIEIAASRCRLMSPESMLPLLSGNLSFLTGGHRDSPERHQTVRNTIRWTYELLPSEVQKLFRLLSVFPAGFTFEAAVRMYVDHIVNETSLDPDLALLEAIETLSDFNLLRKSYTASAAISIDRYTFFETVRVYGLERLTDAGERDSAMSTLESWCVDLASRSAQVSFNGDYAVFDLLQVEYPNIRAVFDWRASKKESRVPLHILRDLAWFMTDRYLLSEAIRWTDVFLDHDDTRNDPPLRAEGLDTAAVVRYWTSNFNEARALQEESLAIRRTVGDDLATAKSIANLANIVFDSGELELASSLLEESAGLSLSAGDRQGFAHSSSLLGRVALARLDFAESQRCLAAAMETFSELGYRSWIALAHQNQGLFFLITNQIREALHEYRESIAIATADGDNWRVVSGLFGFAEIARRDRQFELSIALYAATEHLAQSMEIRLRKVTEELIAGWFSELRRSVDSETFSRAWGEGLSLSRADAARLALELKLSGSLRTQNVEAVRPRSYTAATKAGLTPRETEILVLLSQGLGNRDIATELSISHRTVMQHLSNIFPKIDVTTRTAAAAWAHRHEIV